MNSPHEVPEHEIARLAEDMGLPVPTVRRAWRSAWRAMGDRGISFVQWSAWYRSGGASAETAAGAES